MAVASDGGEDHGGEVRGRRRRLRGLRHVREDESESRPVRQCDAVWCDAVWCDAVQCSAVRCAVWLLPTTDLWRRVGRQVVEHAEDVEGPCGSTQWGLEPHSCRLQLAVDDPCCFCASRAWVRARLLTCANRSWRAARSPPARSSLSCATSPVETSRWCQRQRQRQPLTPCGFAAAAGFPLFRARPEMRESPARYAHITTYS